MIWRWILGIIVFLIFLLCITRVGVRAKFGPEGLTLDVKFGLFHFRILPAKEKKETAERLAAEEQKAAEAARKKKAQKEARKGEKFSVKTERVKGVLADIQSAVNALWPPLKRALGRTRKGIRIHPLQVSLTVGGAENPAAGAQLYGYLNAGVWTVMPALEQVLDIPDPYIHVGLDFESSDTSAGGEAGLTIRVGTLLAVGISVAVPALRWYLKWNKMKKQPETAGDANMKG